MSRAFIVQVNAASLNTQRLFFALAGLLVRFRTLQTIAITDDILRLGYIYSTAAFSMTHSTGLSRASHRSSAKLHPAESPLLRHAAHMRHRDALQAGSKSILTATRVLQISSRTE